MYELQLYVGTVSLFVVGLGILLVVPWVVTMICLLVMKKWKILQWIGISTVVVALLGYGFVSFFGGVPYQVAYRLGMFVPWTAHGLEHASEGFMDEDEEYDVLQLNQKQMEQFVKEVQAQGTWKQERIAPQTVLDAAFVNNTMSNDQRQLWLGQRNYTLPKAPTDCLYFKSTTKRVRPGDFYITRKVYLLDLKTGMLYVYYDDSQWG